MTTLILDLKRDTASLAQKLQHAAARLQLWMDRHEQRRQLAQLPGHLLDDMGLDAERVAEEIHKPFWK
jgi:uncharacterized protein YjiS (DUF1127 family)